MLVGIELSGGFVEWRNETGHLRKRRGSPLDGRFGKP